MYTHRNTSREQRGEVVMHEIPRVLRCAVLCMSRHEQAMCVTQEAVNIAYRIARPFQTQIQLPGSLRCLKQPVSSRDSCAYDSLNLHTYASTVTDEVHRLRLLLGLHIAAQTKTKASELKHMRLAAWAPLTEPTELLCRGASCTTRNR